MTNKVRTIRINAQLGQHIKECYEQIKPIGINAPILVSQKGNCFHCSENQCNTKRDKEEISLKKVKKPLVVIHLERLLADKFII